VDRHLLETTHPSPSRSTIDGRNAFVVLLTFPAYGIAVMPFLSKRIGGERDIDRFGLPVVKE
jgi:hypothetical protein|tara:strand:- start:192 stop:377 length:186 start_codon:yes stop_codon:yes gene_type:complete